MKLGTYKKLITMAKKIYGVIMTVICLIVLAIMVVPAFLHGTYDYIATTNTNTWYFILFIAVLFGASYWLIVKTSRADRYI